MTSLQSSRAQVSRAQSPCAQSRAQPPRAQPPCAQPPCALTPQPRFSDHHRDTVIERVYDVALDPERYEALLDYWEGAVGPLREQAQSDRPLLDDPLVIDHFRRASEFLDRASAASPETHFANMLSQYQHVAAFVFDKALSVTAATPGAMACLSLYQGAALSTAAINPEDVDAVMTCARRLLRDPAPNANAVLRVRSRERAHIIVLRLERCDYVAQSPMILARSTETIWPQGFSRILQRAFDLTTAEADVVHGLIDCCSVAELAQKRGRSVDTIRAQIKSILSKTETHSQVELIRLVLSVMDIAKTTFDVADEMRMDASTTTQLRPAPPCTLVAPDGRRIDYLVLGDPHGAPLLFLPLDFGLVRWPASMEARAAKRGLKIIVPIRASYGKTSPVPRHQDYDAAVINDALAVLKHEAAGPCPILSLGSDSAYGFRMIHQNPDRFTALIACAGVLPMTRPEQFARMEKWHRFILAGAKYTPHLLPFMVKAGFLMARKIGKRGFIHAVYGNCPADVETFEKPEVFDAMVTGSEVALSATHSAHEGFARTVLGMQSTDWSEDVHRARGLCPVIFFNGLQDPEVPAATLQEFQQTYDWIDYRVYADAGQLIFYQQLPEILRNIENFIIKT